MLNEFFFRSRLLFCAVMAAIGGVVGSNGRVSPLWIILPVILAILATVFAAKKGWKPWCLLACALFLYAGLFMGYARASSWRGRGGPAGEVTLLGVIEVGCRGEQGDIIDLLRVSDVSEGSAARYGDRYLLRIRDGESSPIHWGDRLRVRGSLYIFDAESGGVGGSLSADEVEVIGRTGNPFLRLAVAYRDALRAQVEGQLKPDVAGLIDGMVLGDYRLLSARDLKAFRLAGLIHLCAASGLNVGILAVFILWIGGILRISRRMVAVLQVPLLITYALAVGLSVPIQIATIVALLAALAFLLGRDFDYLPALGMAVICLVVRDPAAAKGVSFQLCFAAALGMITLQGPLNEFLKGDGSKLIAILAATMAAQLAVAPLLLLHFGEVSILAIVSNLLVLPLVPAVMALSMLSSLLAVIGVPLAATLLGAAALLSKWILFIARTMAAPGWAALRIFPFSIVWVVVYYSALATAFMTTGKIRRAGKRLLVALIVTAVLFGCLFPVVSLGSGSDTRITFFDVGQGDSALLETPSGATVLVDGGINERVLATDLRSRGIRYLDAVIVSHPDSDHAGGLTGALDTCVIGLLAHPGTKTGGSFGDLLGRAEEAGVPVRTMREGDTLQLGELEMTVYSPPVELPGKTDTNDCSLVIRIKGPGFSLLLPGDVEEEGETMLMSNGENLRSDILKVPHHGGFSETSDDFFASVKPRIAVVSVGEDNPFGHPSRATIDSLHSAGCSVYRTDESGDIVVHVVEGGFRVENER